MRAPSSLHSALDALTQQIQDARRTGRTLRIRGGGSKDFYGAPRTGELLDTTALHGILNYEPSELVVTVAAGTPLATLEAALAEQGQCLPMEPPHFGRSRPAQATVGGMVGAGLSGPARANVGALRDYVLGLQLLNGQAQHLTFGGQVMKNVAGYDVSRLMVGAMGSLGLITQVSLKVLPFAPAEATLVFTLEQGPALACLHAWGAQPLPLNASYWVHDPHAGPQLYLRLRGAAAAVEAACRSLQRAHGAQRLEASQARAHWAGARDQTLPFFTTEAPPSQALWRLSLPQTAPVLALPAQPLIEWHGALRWLWAAADAGPALRTLAAQCGGSVSLFVATPDQPSGERAPVHTHSDPVLHTIAQRLQKSFDPYGVFCPRPAALE